MYKTFIPSRLKLFFEKHKQAIELIFETLKNYKPNIVNAYQYSDQNTPPNPRYKYTDKLYLGCIFYVLLYGSTWESFIGPIPGKQLNKRHHEYIKYGLYKTFFENSLKKYLKTHDVKYLSIDSSILNNKNCIELGKNLPINKNRKGVKLDVIVDDNGSPLVSSIVESTTHDSNIGLEDINKLVNHPIIKKSLESTNGHPYLLADSGYDSNKIKDKLAKAKIKHIIRPNNRGRKYKRKRKILKRHKNQFRKRIKVENFFGIIKRHPKVNCIYEKTIRSFENLLLFLFGSILVNRT